MELRCDGCDTVIDPTTPFFEAACQYRYCRNCVRVLTSAEAVVEDAEQLLLELG
jgi:hypothetical protein